MKYILTLLSLLILTLGLRTFVGSLCDKYAAPKAFELIQAQVEKEIATFVGQKLIAEKADLMLGQLFTARAFS